MGKLIVSKGVDLLLAAWPLVVARVPDARLAVVGFGTYREGLERMTALLGAADLDGVRQLARRGRELEGGPPGELRYLASFLDGLAGERLREYLEAAPEAASAGAFHRPARARRPARAAPRLRGPGDAEHLSGVVRDGRGRGGCVRGASALRRPLGNGRGHRHPRAGGGRGDQAAAVLHARPRRGRGDRLEARPLAPARAGASGPGRRPPWRSWRAGATAGRAWRRG